MIQGLFRKDGRSLKIPVENQERAARLIQAFDDLPFDAAAVLTGFDVPFRLRRLYRMVYLIYRLLYGEKPEKGPPAKDLVRRYRELWRCLNRHIKFYEILLSAMESLVDDAPIDWQSVETNREAMIWGIVQTCYLRLLDDASPAARRIRPEDLEEYLAGTRKEWLPQGDLEAIAADLRKAVRTIVDAVRTHRLEAVEGEVRSLLGRMDDCERRLLKQYVPDAKDEVRRAYETFEMLDAHLFPLELVGGLHEKDIIETIRISPKDAQKGFSRIDLHRKVAGDAVFHFGGFFKRSWRSNDILWGRLDGLCQLVETLLDPGRITALVGSSNWRAKIRDRFFAADGSWRPALDPAALFPHSGEATHEECRRWLRQLLSAEGAEADAARAAALEPMRFGEMVEFLVEAAQLEVLWEDLPNVMADAIEEQVDWNRFQIAKPRKREPTSRIDSIEDAAVGFRGRAGPPRSPHCDHRGPRPSRRGDAATGRRLGGPPPA